MGARRIGRARRVNDGQLIFVEEWFEGREAGMQTEIAVEVDDRVSVAAFWLRDGDGGAQAIVIWFGERDNDVEAIGCAALEKHYQLLLVGHGRGGDGALQEGGHHAHADHGYAALF